MAHYELNPEPLSKIIEAAREAGLTVIERSALYAAATAYVAELEEFIDDHYGADGKGYERGKLHSVMSSLAIVLGFAVHPADTPHEGVWRGIEQDWYTFTSGINSPFAKD